MTEDELRRILAHNPDLRVLDSGDGQQLKPPISGTSSSALAESFETIWRYLDGPGLVHEYRFHPERRWRFDYAHLASKVAIEIDGGVWTGGRHTRARGFLADAEKRNTAQALGWRVFVLGTGQVTIPAVRQIIDATKKPGE